MWNCKLIETVWVASVDPSASNTEPSALWNINEQTKSGVECRAYGLLPIVLGLSRSSTSQEDSCVMQIENVRLGFLFVIPESSFVVYIVDVLARNFWHFCLRDTLCRLLIWIRFCWFFYDSVVWGRQLSEAISRYSSDQKVMTMVIESGT